MNIHQVLCWFRVAEHSFVRRKIGFQLQSSSSSSQLPQCCPVVQCASHCSHFSPTLFILLPRTVYWSGRSWFSVCVCVCVWCMHVFAALFILLPRTVYWSGRSWFCVCVMLACFCCMVYFAAQNCVLIWQKLVLCVCDVCMFLLHGLFCCPEQCTDRAEVGSVWCVHVFAAWFILLPRTVYWSGRSWFSVCDVCMFLLLCLFCCPELCTDLAEVGTVCVCDVCMFLLYKYLVNRWYDLY